MSVENLGSFTPPPPPPPPPPPVENAVPAPAAPAVTPGAAPPSPPDTTAAAVDAATKAANADLGELPWAADDAAIQQEQTIEAIVDKSSQETKAFLQHVARPNLSPAAYQALEKMAQEGKLDAIDPQWGNLRDTVSQMLSEADKSGIAIANAVIEQIGNPNGQIWQGQPNTCVAATAQKAMAMTNPAQYFKLATDLIRNGETQLPNGDTVRLSQENRDWIDAQGLPDDAKMDLMVQASLMDYANGEADFDIGNDVSRKATGDITEYRGLNFEQAKNLNQALLGAPTLDRTSGETRAAVLERKGYINEREGGSPADVGEIVVDTIEPALARAQREGRPGVFVPVRTPDGQDHMVLVRSIDPKSGTVTYMDANGEPQTANRAAFGDMVAKRSDADGGIGGGTSYGSGSSSTGTRRR